MTPELLALLQVILIDVSLSGDNAVIIGMAAAGLAPQQRKKAIAIGIGIAILMRIVFALGTSWLLGFKGIIFIGGLLLSWVCWKMWRELRSNEEHDKHHEKHDRKTMLQAITQITVADVSMSLDNVLAVAGAAREHMMVMAFGLFLAIALMAVAANWVATLLKKHAWLAWAGFGLIVYVSGRMMYDGLPQVVELFAEYSGYVERYL